MKNELKCQLKGRNLVKTSIIKALLHRVNEMLKWLLKVFRQSYTPSFVLCFALSGKIIQMIFRIHPNSLFGISK